MFPEISPCGYYSIDVIACRHSMHVQCIVFLIGKQTSKEKKTIKVITSDLIREIRYVGIIMHVWKN